MKMKYDLISVIVGLVAVILFVSVFNPAFGLYSSNYTQTVYPQTKDYASFTIHGDITNTTTILMRSSHLKSLDEAIQNLGPGDFTGKPGQTKNTLHIELMNANNLVMSDSLDGVWENLTNTNSTLPALLTPSGQQKILPLFNGMIDSIKLDTAPTTPAATTAPQIQQPPLFFYITLALLAIAIAIAIAFPFRVKQVQKAAQKKKAKNPVE